MRVCFGDSSYFISLLNRADAHHSASLAISRAQRFRVVTTGFVLIEVVDALSRPAWRPHVLRLVEVLSTSAVYTTIPPSRELLEAGIDFFSQRTDKSWSLTDCISFVVMEREGITDALTADHHFEQAGFTVLLK